MVPLVGRLNIRCRTILRTQKKNHNFDNHPCVIVLSKYRVWLLRFTRFKALSLGYKVLC